MAWSLVSSTSVQSSGATSAAINTTGATLIVVIYVNSNGSVDFSSDSAGNTWTKLTPKNAPGLNVDVAIFYKINPSTSASHTFTLPASNFPGAAIMAFSGGTPVFDKQAAGNTSNTTTATPGSVTPTNNGALIITGAGEEIDFTGAVDSGFTMGPSANFSAGTAWAAGGAWLSQTTAAAVNPGISLANVTEWADVAAVFSDSGGAAASPNGWWRNESENLPKPPVKFHQPPPAFVSTFKAAVVSGIGWHRDFPEANPRPPIRFQPSPAFVSTFKTAVISGIAFSRNEPESNPRPPRRFEIPPAWAPQPIGQVVTAPPNGWWRNESEILPRAPIRFAPPGVFISTFQTAPISGIAWFEPPDQNRAPAKAPIDYPAPILLPTAPPPTGWWTQSDKVPTKRLNTSDPPSLVFPQVVVTWSFAVSDTIKARVPPRNEPPAFGQPPATTPVGISGMAWFAPCPPDIINRGVNWLTAPAWAPQFIDQVVPPPPVVSPLDRHFICDVGRLMGWG